MGASPGRNGFYRAQPEKEPRASFIQQASILTSEHIGANIRFGNRISSRCPLGENREAGANPARARHCEWGANLREATVLPVEGWEGAEERRSTSQETCLEPLDHARGHA